jgi:hypothetical protein
MDAVGSAGGDSTRIGADESYRAGDGGNKKGEG